MVLYDTEPFRTDCKARSAAVFRRAGSDFLSIDRHFICLRIYSKLQCAVVPYHIFLADIAAAVYRDNCFFQSVSIFNACVKGQP